MEIKVPKGATKNKIIAGRGRSGKRGGTAGRGNNGQNARSGGGVRPGFEGGQMPIYRRTAKRGFSNARFKVEYDVINVRDLDKIFSDGDYVSVDTLKEKGILKGRNAIVKVLGDGEITKKLTVDVDKVSAVAKTKIEAVGGSVVVSSEDMSSDVSAESEQ